MLRSHLAISNSCQQSRRSFLSSQISSEPLCAIRDITATIAAAGLWGCCWFLGPHDQYPVSQKIRETGYPPITAGHHPGSQESTSDTEPDPPFPHRLTRG